MNRAFIESLLRHILGAGITAVTAVMVTSGVVSPLGLGGAEWLVVLAAMWGALVPPVIRWLNTKDPAYGRIAQGIANEVTTVIEAAAAPKAPAKRTTQQSKKK
jgi:hypothetical protein